MTAPQPLEARIAALPLPDAPGVVSDVASRIQVADGPGGAAVTLDSRVPAGVLTHWLETAVATLLDADGRRLDSLEVRQRIPAHAPQGEHKPLATVRNIIAVGSGKGGVGKSTVAVNLAIALARDGARVGILDADIYGPSVPTMLGLSGRPDSPDGKSIEPLRAHGLEAMSIGLLVEQDTPMIWRGPMATSALTQLLNDTRWGDLDYLVVDLPPGTGDIQLTLAQKIPVAGAVIVTTPQDVATLDARKAVRMFEKVGVAVLGFVENMALHVCSNCGHQDHLFGEGGATRMAEEYGYPVLGRLPLERAIREGGDRGCPVASENTATAHACISTARRLSLELAKREVVRRPLSIELSSM